MNKKYWFTTWYFSALIIVVVLLIIGYFIAKSYSQYEETNYNIKQDISQQREIQKNTQKVIDSYK